MGAFPKRETARTSDVGTANTTSSVIVQKFDSRQEITITNDGANVVYLGFVTVPGATPVATVGKGIRLNASGGSWTTTTYTGAIAAIANSAASTVTIAEF